MKSLFAILGTMIVLVLVVLLFLPNPPKPIKTTASLKPLLVAKKPRKIEARPAKTQEVEIPTSTVAPPVEVVVPDEGRSKRLKVYLSDFEGVDWYGSYKRAYVEGDTAKMRLDLPRNENSRSRVENACGAMMGYVNGKSHASEGLSRVEIHNTEDEPLAWTGIDGSCSTFSG